MSISERTGAVTALEYLSSLVGEEYKPYDLSFGTSNISDINSSGKTGWKKKDEIGDLHLLTKSR